MDAKNNAGNDAKNDAKNDATGANNVVLLRGSITSEPVVRDLPSGAVVTQLEVTTRVAGNATSVPVVVHDRPVTVRSGDEVVITGHVSRRFFRVAGATQSRTEVVAAAVVKTTRRRAVERAVDRLAASLRGPSTQ